jgi:hypothetical protein
MSDPKGERYRTDHPCGEPRLGRGAIVQSVAIVKSMADTVVHSSSADAVDWWKRWLDIRVARLRCQTRLRNFATLLEIVHTREDHAEAIRRISPVEPMDHALRVDLLAPMLTGIDRGDHLGVALVRHGPAELFETDRAWIPAVLVAADIAEAMLPRVGIVTRWGGLDITPV